MFHEIDVILITDGWSSKHVLWKEGSRSGPQGRKLKIGGYRSSTHHLDLIKNWRFTDMSGPVIYMKKKLFLTPFHVSLHIYRNANKKCIMGLSCPSACPSVFSHQLWNGSGQNLEEWLNQIQRTHSFNLIPKYSLPT